jgi:hypothetical protein
MDSQAAGVLYSFPLALIAATTVSFLVIFITLQFTLNEAIVAVMGFLSANCTAALVGSSIGSKIEVWHIKRRLDRRWLEEPLSGDQLYSSATKHDDDNDAFDREALIKSSYQNKEESIITSSTEDGRLLKPKPRNAWFKIAIVTAIILGNTWGMIVSSWVSVHFPTRLLDWESISYVENEP